ncbi:MAG: heme ABC transporter permease [Immundisolibacteraceae bacterium]|nr:heme ABC transporter permease [Immundisolibacteraceae bacterium]
MSVIKEYWHKLSSAKHFYPIAGALLPWFLIPALLMLAWGSWQGLVVAPADYQQGDSYRIIFVHVPAAWLSMMAYMVMAINGAIYLVWKIKLADIVAESAAPIGASFTFLALATGSLWGKPMWGTWWVWDARLTSELVLLFLYLGTIALRGAIDDRQRAGRAAGLLGLIGAINVPIIHFSVEWWETLHQPATVSKFSAPSMHPSMLIPLLVMALGFTLFFFAVLMVKIRAGILEQERHSRWLAELYAEAPAATTTYSTEGNPAAMDESNE